MPEKISFKSMKDLRQWCALDFRNYMQYRCMRRKHKPSAIHLACAEWIQNPSRCKIILGWRGCAKTDWFGMEYICWRWLRKKQTKVVAQCNTDTNAGETTSGVKDILKNDPMLKYLHPLGQTAETQFNLRGVRPERGYSIRCAGVATTLTSERADLFLIDDPEAADPMALYTRILEIFDESFVILHKPGRLFPGEECPIPELTQRIILGQPHWEGSAYIPPPPDPHTGEMVDHPLRNDDVFRIPAMVNSSFEPDDQKECLSSVPEIYSDEEMAKQKTSITARKWRLNMMLITDPEDAERAVIPLNHIAIEQAKPDHTIMVIDPADGGNCEWGLAAGGLLRSRYHFTYMDGITEADVAKSEGLDPNHATIGELMWKTIFDICDDYEVDSLYIEANWAPAIKAARRYISKHDIELPVNEFHAHTKKLHRIVTQWEMPVKNGQVSASPIVMVDPKNRRQMADLRHNRLPNLCDRIDAGGKLLEILSESSVTDAVDDSDKLLRPGDHDAYGDQQNSAPSSNDPLRSRHKTPMRSRAARLART